MIDQMCRLPLQSAPGAELRYSNAWIRRQVRLAERVDGRPIWEIARERVLDPLGLNDIVADPRG